MRRFRRRQGEFLHASHQIFTVGWITVNTSFLAAAFSVRDVILKQQPRDLLAPLLRRQFIHVRTGGRFRRNVGPGLEEDSHAVRPVGAHGEVECRESVVRWYLEVFVGSGIQREGQARAVTGLRREVQTRPTVFFDEAQIRTVRDQQFQDFGIPAPRGHVNWRLTVLVLVVDYDTIGPARRRRLQYKLDDTRVSCGRERPGGGATRWKKVNEEDER